ncbi:MAG: ABC transporter permease [Clostridiales bacterium]|nr:ABC transporter permease [Clostridiales bacterium]
MNSLRGTKAIIGSFFHKSGQMGAQASSSSLLASIGFVAVLAAVVLSWIMWWFPYHLFSDEVYNIVVVNAPESFKEYNEETQDDRNQTARANSQKNNFFYAFYHKSTYVYTYDGYGTTKFYYKETDALYDFVTFGEWMNEKDAYLTVVFPSDFEETLQARQDGLIEDKPQILTYYRTDSMEYSAMKNSFVDTYLSGYQSKLREEFGLDVTTITDSEIIDVPIETQTGPRGFRAVGENLNRTFVPILIFIILLYASMSTGTNVIAGQKERGTFTGILLTPLPRENIIIGYLTGVAIKAFIPAAIAALVAEVLTLRFDFVCFLAILFYIFILELLIASITILISVINDTVVSAQTAFLPIFLILVSVCITCIQSATERPDVYMYIPVHGQFYGIGEALNGNVEPTSYLSSCITTIILAIIIVAITVKLLHSEKYTVSVDTVTDKEIKFSSGEGKQPLLYKLNTITDHFHFVITETFYPLMVLSFYQFLAMIPVVIVYMRKAEYSTFIQDLANVSTMKDLFDKTFEIFGIFLTDPLFLGLMTIGYLAIILTYVIHSGRINKVKGFRNKITSIGYPLTSVGHNIKHYCLGFIFGFLMLSATVGIMYATGQITFEGFGISSSAIGVFVLNILMWFPQGASEEVMFRGYMISAFSKRYNRVVGVAVSSVLFSAFHSLNKGYTPLASVNLILIAVLFALIYLLTDDIWMTSAMHTAWNLTQGNIFGLQVSGNNTTTAIVHTVYAKDYASIITGGEFGPEGGLAVTAVTAVCLAIVIILLVRKNKRAVN